MTQDTQHGEPMTIGQLARRTGVPVRTIRYYSDEGLLEPLRTPGGHRVFDPAVAVDRLLLIRQLRGLGVGMARIRAVVEGSQCLADALAAERVTVQNELRHLSWRSAALAAARTGAPAERARRLALLATVRGGDAAYDTLIEFWRGVLPTMPTIAFDRFVAVNVPRIPPAPTPDHVLAFAELVALVGEPTSRSVVAAQLWRPVANRIRDRNGLLADLAQVYDRTRHLVLESVTPRGCHELDQFVAAHSIARDEPDTPAFRRRLLGGAADGDSRVRRYWRLTSRITGNPATTGDAHEWLVAGLRRTTTPDDFR